MEKKTVAVTKNLMSDKVIVNIDKLVIASETETGEIHIPKFRSKI